MRKRIVFCRLDNGGFDSEKQHFLHKEGKPIRQIKKKVLILGEGGGGKTTLLYRYVNQVFIDSTKMTIGSDFYVKKITHNCLI